MRSRDSSPSNRYNAHIRVTRYCTCITYACIARTPHSGRLQLSNANEFRNFVEADVIWDNARIACTPGTDSARLAPRPVSRDNRGLPLPSMRMLPAERTAIGDAAPPRAPSRSVVEKLRQHPHGGCCRGLLVLVVIYFNARSETEISLGYLPIV